MVSMDLEGVLKPYGADDSSFAFIDALKAPIRELGGHLQWCCEPDSPQPGPLFKITDGANLALRVRDTRLFLLFIRKNFTKRDAVVFESTLYRLAGHLRAKIIIRCLGASSATCIQPLIKLGSHAIESICGVGPTGLLVVSSKSNLFKKKSLPSGETVQSWTDKQDIKCPQPSFEQDPRVYNKIQKAVFKEFGNVYYDRYRRTSRVSQVSRKATFDSTVSVDMQSDDRTIATSNH